MLDRLLGRAALKDELAALEDEKRRLEEQLEAESERRREAVRERQDAEERVNRLEDRIAELEDRVARAEKTEGDEGEPAFRGVETLRGDRLESVLARLESVETGPEGALSAMVREGAIPEAVRDTLGERTPLVERAAPCLVYVDDAGLVSAALSPPLPPEPFAAWNARFRVEREWLLPPSEHAVALVRADRFALGTYRDGERVDVVAFESDVKAAHSKGGFSQGRFERRRDAQIDEHLEKCREAIESREVDPLYVVGEGTLLGEFADVAAATRAVDATGDPEAALGEAVAELWSVPLRLL